MQEPIVKEIIIDSKSKWAKFKLWLIVEDQLILTMEQTAEEFLKEELWENSLDFKILKKIIESSNWELDWKEVLKRIDINNWKIRWMWSLIIDKLDFRWSSLQGEVIEKIMKGELDLWVNIKLGGNNPSVEKILELEELNWDLDLSESKITLWGKLKRIWGHLNLKWVKLLKSVWKLSYVHGDIKAQWSNTDLQLDIIRRIKANKLYVDSMTYLWWNNIDLDKIFSEKVLKVGLDLRNSQIRSLGKLEEVKFLILQWVDTLETIGNLKIVDGFADFAWAGVKSQKEAIEKMNKWELDIVWIPIFGWKVEWIEELLEVWDIPWILSCTGISPELQDKFINALESDKLKVKEYADFDKEIIKWYDQTPYN